MAPTETPTETSSQAARRPVPGQRPSRLHCPGQRPGKVIYITGISPEEPEEAAGCSGKFRNRLGRWPEDRCVVAVPGRCPGLDNRLALRAEELGSAPLNRSVLFVLLNTTDISLASRSWHSAVASE